MVEENVVTKGTKFNKKITGLVYCKLSFQVVKNYLYKKKKFEGLAD